MLHITCFHLIRYDVKCVLFDCVTIYTVKNLCKVSKQTVKNTRGNNRSAVNKVQRLGKLPYLCNLFIFLRFLICNFTVLTSIDSFPNMPDKFTKSMYPSFFLNQCFPRNIAIISKSNPFKVVTSSKV